MPTMSIGMPVYNGSRYLEEAIRSVLGQTFSDLEIVVSDNASTDRTPEIARDLAASDPRIRYFRNESNLGAAPNYNMAFRKSSGTYFKWLAHDDRLLPRYLETTLAALEARPEVVLANTAVAYIDEHGEYLGVYESVVKDADIESPARRFAALILRSHTSVDFFGLVRRSAMKGSLLHGSFHGADKAFLAQMALRGRLLQLGEPLVQMREHPHRYTRSTQSARMKAAWHDASRAGKLEVPIWTLYRTYRGLVDTEEMDERDRRACRRVLRRFWFDGWNGVRLVADLASIPFPTAMDRAVRLKLALLGGPGNFND